MLFDRSSVDIERGVLEEMRRSTVSFMLELGIAEARSLRKDALTIPISISNAVVRCSGYRYQVISNVFLNVTSAYIVRAIPAAQVKKPMPNIPSIARRVFLGHDMFQIIGTGKNRQRKSVMMLRIPQVKVKIPMSMQ